MSSSVEVCSGRLIWLQPCGPILWVVLWTSGCAVLVAGCSSASQRPALPSDPWSKVQGVASNPSSILALPNLTLAFHLFSSCLARLIRVLFPPQFSGLLLSSYLQVSNIFFFLWLLLPGRLWLWFLPCQGNRENNTWCFSYCSPTLCVALVATRLTHPSPASAVSSSVTIQRPLARLTDWPTLADGPPITTSLLSHHHHRCGSHCHLQHHYLSTHARSVCRQRKLRAM